MCGFSEIPSGKLNVSSNLESESKRDVKTICGQNLASQAVGSMQSCQALIAVIAQQQSSTLDNADLKSFAMNMLIRQGNAVSQLGKLFLDLLIATSEAARLEADSARDNQEFVEKQAASRIELVKRVLVQMIFTQDNVRRQILRGFMSRTHSVSRAVTAPF